MFHILVSRLSGLANRRIFYVPISRNLRMNTSLIRTIKGLFERCVTEGGVLVVQPEHILSLKLMHINNLLSPPRNKDERPIADDLGVSRDPVVMETRDALGGSDIILPIPDKDSEESITDELGALQDWVTEVSRDLLDESDEILHVRYQLIYTAGKIMPVDDYPSRWITIQRVFSRLQAHATTLHASYPTMFSVDTRLKGFPTIRILDSYILGQI